MSDPRYTWAQQYLGWWPWTAKWTCPPADDTTDLPRDTRLATPVDQPTPWPDSLKDIPVKMGGSVTPWQGSISGKPVQYGTAASDQWTVVPVATWGNDGIETIRVPRPRSGYVWVEGYPSRDGAWDRRRIVVDGQRVIETILTFPDQRRVARYSVYDMDGTLVAGRAVTNGGHPQFRTILRMNEPAHRLAIDVPDYARGMHDNGGVSDGTGDFTFPRSGGLIRLSLSAWMRTIDEYPDPSSQPHRVGRMLHFYGAYVVDRGGPNIGHANIDHQAGVFNRRVEPWTLGDFEEARDL